MLTSQYFAKLFEQRKWDFRQKFATQARNIYEELKMFGKPHWFRPKKLGWGLVPITWQGWVYMLVWAALIAGVFNVLVFVPIDGRAWRIPEAIVWLAVSIGALILDVRGIFKAMKADEDKKRYFIGDEDAQSHVTTRNYDLHVRD